MIDVFNHKHIDMPILYEDLPAEKCVLCDMVRMNVMDADECLDPSCVFHGAAQ